MTISIRHAVLMVLLLGLSVVSGGTARAEVHYIGAHDRVSATSSLTYLDLALQFAPGLSAKPANGDVLARLPHLGGPDMRVTIANPAIGAIERVDLQQDGKPIMALLVGLGSADDAAQSVSILALYDMTGTPRLIDAMDVGMDRETFLQEAGHLVLSPDIAMIFLSNSHHNAGEEYLQTSLIGIWEGKLHEVDTIFSMSWNAGDRRTATTFHFLPVKDAVAVDADVEIRKIHCDDDCAPDSQDPATIERLRVRYRWNAENGKFTWPAKAYDRIPLPDMEQ